MIFFSIVNFDRSNCVLLSDSEHVVFHKFTKGDTLLEDGTITVALVRLFNWLSFCVLCNRKNSKT